MRAFVGMLRHRCASVPPSTLLAALALAAAVLWSWHLWQAQVQQVRMPVGRTESVITTLGSFSARAAWQPSQTALVRTGTWFKI